MSPPKKINLLEQSTYKTDKIQPSEQEISPVALENISTVPISDSEHLAWEMKVKQFARKYNLPDFQCNFLIHRFKMLNSRNSYRLGGGKYKSDNFTKITNRILSNIFHLKPVTMLCKELHKEIKSIFGVSRTTLDYYRLKEPLVILESSTGIPIIQDPISTPTNSKSTTNSEREEKKANAIRKFAAKHNLPDYQCRFLIYQFANETKNTINLNCEYPTFSITQRILANVFHSKSETTESRQLHAEITKVFGISATTMNRYRKSYPITEFSESREGMPTFSGLNPFANEAYPIPPSSESINTKTSSTVFSNCKEPTIAMERSPKVHLSEPIKPTVSEEKLASKAKDIKNFAYEYNLTGAQCKYLTYAYAQQKKGRATETTYSILGHVYFSLPQNKRYKDLISDIKSVFENISGNTLQRYIKKCSVAELDDEINHAILFEDWKDTNPTS